MRSINAIKADISKLEAELADVQDHTSARDAAYNILLNLGWTRSGGRWHRPAPSPAKMVDFDASKMTHIKAGDFITHKDYKDTFRVHSVNGYMVLAQRVLQVSVLGYRVATHMQPLHANYCKVVAASKELQRVPPFSK